MGVGIALHQPARLEDGDRKLVIFCSGCAGEIEPGVAMRDLALVTQRAAAKVLQAAEYIERQEPSDGAGLHAPSMIDHAIERLAQTGLAFEPQAQPRGQRTQYFF